MPGSIILLCWLWSIASPHGTISAAPDDGTNAGQALRSRAQATAHVAPALRVLAASHPSRIITTTLWIGDARSATTVDPLASRRHALDRIPTRAARHTLVVDALRSDARAEQGAVLRWLEERAQSDATLSWNAHWLVNAVTLRAPAALVIDLARHPTVDWIAPAPRLISPAPLRLPAEEQAPTPETSERAPPEYPRLQLPPGIIAIRADEVWHELGVSGAGRLIGLLDTGVDADHPALWPSWRGHATTASEAWLDLVDGTTAPHDPVGHGTRVLGIAGGLNRTTADTMGVAWGAEWIAAAAIGQPTGTEYDADVIAALEWLCDPDGDPETIDDVPDVLICAFGIEPSLPGEPPYLACDDRFQQAIDHLELAGTVVVWSAGNSGPDPGSVASPADLAAGNGRNLAVGAIDATHSTFPYPVPEFSSRGPSDCDGISVKPDLVAPGLSVRTTFPGPTVGNFSGTSAAVPHVGGVVALIREVAPELSVAAIKEILLSATIDLAALGPDNDAGHGLIDARLAVDLAIASGVSVGDQAPGTAVHLGWAQPNPTRGMVTLTTRLARDRPLVLEIYAADGRRLRRLDYGHRAAGRHRLDWDGRDAEGRHVPAGIYFMQVEGQLGTPRKVVLMR